MILKRKPMPAQDLKPVIILGLSANALSVARSLGRRGIPVFGADVFPAGPAQHSRYLSKVYRAPEAKDEKGFLAFLMSLARERVEKAVLFPTADEYVVFLSKYRRELKPYYEFLLPDEEVVDIFLNKEKTAAFAQEHGIPHPRTGILRMDEDPESQSRALTYPCIAKPRFAHVWRREHDGRKVFVLNSPEEFMAMSREMAGAATDVLVQEIVPGPDSNIYQFLALCDRQSRVLATFCCHKLRQYPPHFGIACLCESKFEPRIFEAGMALLDKVRYKGIIAMEFKFDEGRKTPIFLEANLRTSYFGELAVASGVDFPFLIYRYLVHGEGRAEKSGFRDDVKLLNLELDLGCYARLRRKKEITLREWLKAFRGKSIVHTYFAFDDLKPWLMVYGGLIRRLFLRLFRRAKVQRQPREERNDERRPGPGNVLHLVSSQGMFGAERVILNIARGLNTEDMKVMVAAFRHRPQPHLEIIAAAREAGLATAVIDVASRFDPRPVFRLYRLLRKHWIDILHTHNYKSDTIGFLAARMARIPVVATAHGFTDMTARVSLYERIDRFILRIFFRKVVVVADSVLPRFPRGKKVVIPNALDVTRMAAEEKEGRRFREQFAVAENDVLLGTVGRLSREKNQQLLLKAVYPLIRSRTRLKLVIVGEGPLKEDLRRFVSDRYLTDKVIFTGFVKDMAAVYRGMDIFILPSRTEGVPLTVLEAMAAGVPVVATRVGSIPRIIEDGKTGLLVPSDDERRLRDAVAGLLSNESRRRQLAGAAFEFVRTHYSIEHMLRGYRDVYREVLG